MSSRRGGGAVSARMRAAEVKACFPAEGHDFRKLARDMAKGFEKNLDPIIGMSAFLTAYEAGEPIPRQIKEWLAQAIYSWRDEDVSFDRSLGLCTNKGKTSHLVRGGIEHNRRGAMFEIWELREVLKISPEDAAAMVAARHAAEVENGSLAQSAAYSTDTLIRYWRSEKNHLRKFHDGDSGISIIDWDSASDLVYWLSAYPSCCREFWNR